MSEIIEKLSQAQNICSTHKAKSREPDNSHALNQNILDMHRGTKSVSGV